ncbi:MAG: MFS transporter [Agathobacter sp.]|nr:MFS transporter [Agathobacter sp.]
MDDKKTTRRNLWMFPMGTLGRDMLYNLVTSFLLTFILFTKGLTAAQLTAVTAIMVIARVFDALNDPIMGTIIENTRTRWGKFKPWMVIGILLTSVLVIMVFCSNLTGWDFVILFAVFYILYSLAYTMHDISYWGMVPALGSDAGTRDQLTSRASLFAGIGSTLAGIAIPMFTAGAMTIGGSSNVAYKYVAIAVSILAPLFLCATLFWVKENRQPVATKKAKGGLKQILTVVKENDQLRWIAIIFLIQQVGNGLIVGGIGSTYVYFTYGYEGGLYSLFTIIGMSATAFLMIFYPAISRKINRKPLMNQMAIISVVGYVLMIVSRVIPGWGFWVLVIGYMLSNFGQYSYYLIMMISIINTVEYNEYQNGVREEAMIASVRPLMTKMSSAIIALAISASYIIFGVTNYTNKISELETMASSGAITEAEKLASITEILSGVTSGQSWGLLLFMTILPCALMLISNYLYQKNYKLDEEEYARICKELELNH